MSATRYDECGKNAYFQFYSSQFFGPDQKKVFFETAKPCTMAERSTDRTDKPSKSWTFTLNNPTETEEKILKDLDCSYLIYGKEIGENGTPHFQGCVTFATTKRLSGLKKVLARAHWEKVINLESARNYCMKDGDYVIRDNRKPQGMRTDLQEGTNCLKTDGILAMAEKHPELYVKYHAGLHKLEYIYRLGKRKFRETTVHWVYGPTDTGKTRSCWEVAGDSVWASHPGQGVNWFDGYYGQKAVIFDDFRGEHIKFPDMLRILDVYPLQLSVKGGFTHWTPEVIFITSPKKPAQCYGYLDEDVQQLLRRIHYTWQFPEEKPQFHAFFGQHEIEIDDESEHGYDHMEVPLTDLVDLTQ